MTTKRNLKLGTFKVFLALVSFAGTIGIWNNLANKEMANSSASTQTNDGINLPPIPTLVPLVSVDGVAANTTAATPASTVLRSVDMPVVSAPVVNNQSSVTVLNAPVTRTRAS